MRKMTVTGLILIVIVALGASPLVTAQDYTPGGGSPVPAHLVLSVGSGGEARINRMDWDVNAFAPVFPGSGVRASDYIDLSGRSTVVVLCTDLAVLEQRGSEVPRCNPYPDNPAFYYFDDPVWTPPDGPLTVATLPADMASTPPEIDTSVYNRTELSGGDVDAVINQMNTITGLNIPNDSKVFALASLYTGKNLYFEALSAFTALPDLGCSARRPTVDPPTGEEILLVHTPVVYLRIGELYQILGLTDDALRYYRCALDLSQAVNDPASAGLAYARQANAINDPVQATQLYQAAIDNYAVLGAQDNLTDLLEICGSRNCTLPQ